MTADTKAGAHHHGHGHGHKKAAGKNHKDEVKKPAEPAPAPPPPPPPKACFQFLNGDWFEEKVTEAKFAIQNGGGWDLERFKRCPISRFLFPALIQQQSPPPPPPAPSQPQPQKNQHPQPQQQHPKPKAGGDQKKSVKKILDFAAILP